MESVDGSSAERGHLNIRKMASCRTISTATQPVYEASGGVKQRKSYFRDHGGLGGKREGIGRILIGWLDEWFKLAETLSTAGLGVSSWDNDWSLRHVLVRLACPPVQSIGHPKGNIFRHGTWRRGSRLRLRAFEAGARGWVRVRTALTQMTLFQNKCNRPSAIHQPLQPPATPATSQLKVPTLR